MNDFVTGLSQKNTKYGIELICFDANHELKYAGKCKIKIDCIRSVIIVEPANKDYKKIPAKFKWKFDKRKNILFVYAEHDSHDFALCFDKDRRCKKVYDIICGQKEKGVVEKEFFQQRFLIPILKKIALNNYPRLKEIMVKWINSHNNSERKKEYLKFMKEYKILDLDDEIIVPSEIDNLNSQTRKEPSSLNGNKDRNYCNLRKRRAAAAANEFGENNESERDEENDGISARVPSKKQKISLPELTKIVASSNLKLLCVKGLKHKEKRLLIFTDSDKEECYEFVWNRKRKFFYCLRCHESQNQLEIIAMFNCDDNGNQFVKTEDKEHICTPIPYIEKKYYGIKILLKPEYEILEDCNTFSRTVIVLFDPINSTQCWELHWYPENQSFRCTGCSKGAKLFNQNQKNEYLEWIIQEHRCKTRLFQREEFYKFKNFVLLPNFEIQTKLKNGKEVKTLVVFDEKDRTKCYYYFYQTSHQQYLCNGCMASKKSVSAKICYNNDGDEYVLLSNFGHICKSRPYASSLKTKVLPSSKFKVMESTSNGVSKLFIFDESSSNQNTCHIFSQRGNPNRYLCTSCERKGIKNIYTVYLCKNENYEYFVEAPDRKHSCVFQKYEPKKYVYEKIRTFNFSCYRRILEPKTTYVTIAHPQNKNLCYIFNYNKHENNFLCKQCWRQKNYLVAKVGKSENGETYLSHKSLKHVCKPTKFSSFETSEYEIIDKNELKIKEKPVKKAKIDESKILRMPAFELQSSKYGNADYKLIIFDPNNRKLFYQYSYSTSYYFCHNCKKKNVRVTAKIQTDENGEKFVILGENEHVCEPLSDQNSKIINAEHFIVQNQNTDKSAALIVFTSPSHELYYEFNFCKSANHFKCINCYKLKSGVSARICKNKNDTEFLQMGKNGHICTPQKYEDAPPPPKPLQTITLPNNLIEFHSNKNGETNMKLIFFTSEEKEFAYFYYGNARKIYYCLACQKLKSYVSAKLCKNAAGKECLILDQKPHICAPKKYVDPLDYSNIPVIPFELQKNTKGEADKKLIIFTSEKREYGYIYMWKRNKCYICTACHYRKAHVSATILEENGKTLVKLCPKQHICQPKKL